jgi:serine/threonine protein kinase
VSVAPRDAIVGAVGGQSAEQIIAGVVLSERLAVTMYGAIHRAQWSGQRNMRGLVVDPKMLAESAFRIALTDPRTTATAIHLDRQTIVPTVAVESNGPEVVIVTRGVGRYVTVQDLIAAARANRGAGGKLPLPVAAAIGKSIVEALAAAHSAGLVHGAVHPRSVLVDEDGGVRLGDFIVGRALTTAVAQGADSSLWRGLAGYLAPELVVGEDPTPSCDVFAAGAMLFTMLSGEVPPGTLHVTPAVERLVQRALDTDRVRRYKNASDLLENLLEAFEDDRWQIADRGEVIRAAGLSQTGGNIDDATEDLLASLGNSAVQVTPMRQSAEIRAEAAGARTPKPSLTSQNRLDALLADLDDSREHTAVEELAPFKHDPISELIPMDPRRREAIASVKRVPSLDDPDDDEPGESPPAERDSELDLRPAPRGTEPPPRAQPRARSQPPTRSQSRARSQPPERSSTRDEVAAMDALFGLDEPVRRVSSAAEQAALAAAKLEEAAKRAEAAAARVDISSEPETSVARPSARRSVARPILIPEEIPAFDLPPPRLKSRAFGVVLMLVLVGCGVGFYYIYRTQQEATAGQQARDVEKAKDADEKSKLANEALADAGSVVVSSTPSEAGVWLRLGRTPLDTLRLSATSTHELALLLEGHELAEVQVQAGNWQGEGDKRKAIVNVTLKKQEPAGGPKGAKRPPAALPLQPTAVHGTTTATGRGPISLSSAPPDAEAFLYVGLTGTMRFSELTAGRDYEFVVVKDGYKPRHITIKADDWRDGGDPNIPIDAAKKKARIDRAVELEPLPDARKPAEKGR